MKKKIIKKELMNEQSGNRVLSLKMFERQTTLQKRMYIIYEVLFILAKGFNENFEEISF